MKGLFVLILWLPSKSQRTHCCQSA